MERIIVLREQAKILRALAYSFDSEKIQDQLLDLAVECDDMAKSLEANPQAAGLKPVGAPRIPL